MMMVDVVTGEILSEIGSVHYLDASRLGRLALGLDQNDTHRALTQLDAETVNLSMGSPYGFAFAQG